MTQQPDTSEAQPVLPLKIEEQDHDPKNPWGDDVLDRKEIADHLTRIVRGQEAPFVITVDGRWGTGKTFLLKRWRQDLENQGWQAIYYNAWEDDFAGDPLISVTGQLAEHLKKRSLWAKVRTLGRLVGPFVQPVASAASLATTGVPVPNIRRTKQPPPSHLADYLEKRAAKDELRSHLADLAAEVREETGQPLVFIIDELDRCRPTFAIELLERVKHIFDVPNIVFVFGINRAELTKALVSVYGEIDSGTYLRRFFDMEFVLPDADPTKFCSHLLDQFGLREFFQELAKHEIYPMRAREVETIEGYLPVVLGNMGLSLRDMDYCVRLLALATRGLSIPNLLHPALFLLIAAVKITEPELYQRFVEGNARGAEVIDYLNNRTPAGVGGTERQLIDRRDQIEVVQAAIYSADDAETVRRQLERLRTDGQEPDRPEYLAEEHARLGPNDSATLSRIGDLIARDAEDTSRYGATPGYVGGLLDLYSDFVRPR